MKEFYLELAQEKELQLKMATIGYEKRCREIASKLMTCGLSESYCLIRELHEICEAFKDLEGEHNNLVKRYQEEALKKGENENA